MSILDLKKSPNLVKRSCVHIFIIKRESKEEENLSVETDQTVCAYQLKWWIKIIKRSRKQSFFSLSLLPLSVYTADNSPVVKIISLRVNFFLSFFPVWDSIKRDSVCVFQSRLRRRLSIPSSSALENGYNRSDPNRPFAKTVLARESWFAFLPSSSFL